MAGLLGLVLALVAPFEPSQAARDQSRSAMSGPARVIDGDTIAIGETRIRLEGIDAPETSQLCTTATKTQWSCGQSAKSELMAITAGKMVRCESSGNDRYGRVLGICWAGSLELNAEMVRRGFAWAFVRYSSRLVQVEAEARGRSIGIWQADNEPAWGYRTGRWTTAENTAPRACAIKGNITNAGRTYHLPWNRNYDAVRINPSKGERWFCSEAEALAAGWQPVRTN